MLKKESNVAKSNFDLRKNILSKLTFKQDDETEQKVKILNDFYEAQKELKRNMCEDNKSELIGSIADVRLLLRQIQILYNLSDEEIQKKEEEKLVDIAKLLD